MSTLGLRLDQVCKRDSGQGCNVRTIFSTCQISQSHQTGSKVSTLNAENNCYDYQMEGATTSLHTCFREVSKFFEVILRNIFHPNIFHGYMPLFMLITHCFWGNHTGRVKQSYIMKYILVHQKEQCDMGWPCPSICTPVRSSRSTSKLVGEPKMGLCRPA